MRIVFQRIALFFRVLVGREEPVLKSELETLVKDMVEVAVAAAIKGAAGGA